MGIEHLNVETTGGLSNNHHSGTTTITTATVMSSQNEFPWDTLKAETLRSIVHDLGIPVARSLRKREGMVKALISVTEKGCESVS